MRYLHTLDMHDVAELIDRENEVFEDEPKGQKRAVLLDKIELMRNNFSVLADARLDVGDVNGCATATAQYTVLDDVIKLVKRYDNG